MELLPSFGVNSELSRETVRLNSADDGDVLITRKKMNARKAVVEKHCEDVWSLSCAIRRDERVPHVLPKNGKRGKEDFVRSQSDRERRRLMVVLALTAASLKGAF